MTHEEKVAQWIGRGAGKIGTEIGPGASPVPGLSPLPIYVDCFKAFGPAANVADYYGHACQLPFHDHSLDYVIASHVLEHVANPVAALAEWYRVVRPGGIIYFVVPNRLSAFDRPRELTTVEHMLDDHLAGATAHDPTHIDEFAFGVDWAQYRPDASLDDVPAQRAAFARGMHAAVERGEDINIHFHTFEPSNVRELLERLTVGTVPGSGRARTPPRAGTADVVLQAAGSGVPALLPRFNWELVDFADGFPAHSPNGVLAILRVHKGWRARADADAFRLRAKGDRRAVLRDDARPFAEWAAEKIGLGGIE
jgi:SAM-dependent methyltransferase